MDVYAMLLIGAIAIVMACCLEEGRVSVCTSEYLINCEPRRTAVSECVNCDKLFRYPEPELFDQRDTLFF